MTNYRLLPAGDMAVCIEFGEGVDRRINGVVLALARRVREAAIAGVIECVPTFRSLMIQYDPLLLPYAALVARIGKLAEGLQAGEAATRSFRLPVCYDETVAPDLKEVAMRVGLTPAELVERHSAVAYHVYMLGFLPGQPYLGDVPAALALPRRQSPRPTIPAGSVGIAMTMTCIYPAATPCGWHLIGRCPVPLWELQQGASEPLLQPGDRVVLEPVSLRDYERLLAEAAAEPAARWRDSIRDVAA
ncbi:MAG: 5-oxoprolinase subunit PxpB [Hyphomicrobiales bacterium]|nr:5-oxoprolinase subunit PxpB [Hyphomicrobiales bacterium]